jgi:hypothetical protein
MPDIFRVVREISQSEIAGRKRDIIGITSSAPKFIDQNGVMEWVCDVRIGVRENQGLIRDVLVSQSAMGVVNDLNVPVLCRKNEAGRLTVIGREQVKLPDISLTTYSFNDLGFLFMANAEKQADGTYLDGYGYTIDNPEELYGVSTTWNWVVQVTSVDEFGDADETTANWEAS